MEHLTIRRLPASLAKALDRERRRRGTSLNQTVIDLLSQCLGATPGGARQNGLARLSGTWSDQDLESFELALAPTEQIDEELWR
jgi:hypothetical protein